MAAPPPSSAVQGKLQGHIRPPPDIRAIVDKTAAFVGRVGDDVEAKIVANEQGNLKFGFLRANDPYHAYYRHKVAEARVGGLDAPPPEAAAAEGVPPIDAPEVAVAPPSALPATSVKRSAAFPNPLARALRTVDLASPPEDGAAFCAPSPQYASAAEAETVRLTAQFTACGGRAFLAALALREASNPTFFFLRPTHALFSFFTGLVDAYAKVLAPSPTTRAYLTSAAVSPHAMLERCVARLEHARVREEAARREAEATGLADPLHAAAIDWHDFSVVETIEFGDEGHGTCAAQPGASAFASTSDDVDMEVEEDTDVPAHVPIADEEAGGERLNIRTDYVRGTSGGGGASHFVHPISGKAVPIGDVSEHLRIELLDPKWQLERAKAAQKFTTTAQVHNEDVAENLRRLAARRVDIFGGSGGEATGMAAAAVASLPSVGGQVQKRARGE